MFTEVAPLIPLELVYIVDVILNSKSKDICCIVIDLTPISESTVMIPVTSLVIIAPRVHRKFSAPDILADELFAYAYANFRKISPLSVISK